MNTAKRLQLLLSPVLIAMLALMLAVVSFGWYQAEMGDVEIEASGESVDITVEAPDYSHVELEALADSYVYSNGVFTLQNVGENLEGYFGQTAEYDLDAINSQSKPENDRPYIIFYKATITTTYPNVPLTGAYVEGLTITKQGNVLYPLENGEKWTEDNTEFMVSFYTYDSENKTMVETNPSDSFEISGQEGIVYLGIRFEDPKNRKTFEFDDIAYYGSIYSLEIRFVE